MATALQIAANRRNAQRSTGPRTAEGKTVIRMDSGSSCAQRVALAQDTRYNFDSNVDFSKYKTYKWVDRKGADKPFDSGWGHRPGFLIAGRAAGI